ncbi:suppressor of cytokine signaling 4 [Microplitis mediator]|uniref:suppressor of cytokine signaling 4 n=1 Tax=Microplitis mediator TaxID=375433 RepID=UPI002556C243|nr:suppressor of cytokine signaling 4 [Microplitis mediator]
MGQRFASFREFFKMDSKQSHHHQQLEQDHQQTSEAGTDDNQHASAYVMPNNEDIENTGDNENNGNQLDNSLADENKEQNRNINNEELNLENHNSRFESIYSQPLDSTTTTTTTTNTIQDNTNKACNNNGNFVGATETEFKQQQEPCCSSSGSSSSEDSSADPSLRRTSKTLSFVKRKCKQRNKDQNQVCNHTTLSSKKKRSNWVLKFNCAKSKGSKNTDMPDQPNNSAECVCTGYRSTEEHPMGAGVVFNNHSIPQSPVLGPLPPSPVIDLSRFNPAEYPMEDCDERARQQRAREMEEGVEPPPGYRPNYSSAIQVHPNGITVEDLTALFQSHVGIQAAAVTALSQMDITLVSNIERPAHTQVDYVHCLVPDLQSITACTFYWGKMDRYEAERLLDGKQEGTFLLRDSAQEEFLFSVSFRKYGKSLHARIEQWNHKFSFDSHDPGVYASETVCGLIEHYKDPSCCMFFEPMLTIPLHRNFAFPLQHLCRAVITTRTTYDGINKLQLPKTLKSYLKEYHYKQRVRVRRLDSENDIMLYGRSISYLPMI